MFNLNKFVKKGKFIKMAADFWDKSWSYEIPDTNDPYLGTSVKSNNAKERMIDFYLLDIVNPDLLYKAPNFGQGFAQSGTETPSKPGEVSGDIAWENIIQNLKKAKQELIKVMATEYVEDLRYSSSCEARHIWKTKAASKQVNLSSNWLTQRKNVAETIKQSNDVSLENEISDISDAIKSLKAIKSQGIDVSSQVNELEKRIKVLNDKKNAKSLEIEKYVNSLAERFIPKTGYVEHSWKIAKTLSDENKKIYQMQQLRLMAEFILSATPEEWDAIIEKSEKFKQALNTGSSSTHTFGDWRDKRYTHSDGLDINSYSDYYQSYLKAYEAGFTNRELALFCTAAQLDGRWNSSYGGPNWAVIAKTMNTVDELAKGVNKNSKALGDRSATIAIDQAHNLQHNNASAFNKCSNVYGDSSFFEKVLNFKADASTEPEHLLSKASPSLAPIVQFYFYHTGRPTKESFPKVSDWSNLLSQKAKDGTLCDYLKNTNFGETELSSDDTQELQSLQNDSSVIEANKLYSFINRDPKDLKENYPDVYEKLSVIPSGVFLKVKKYRKLLEKNRSSNLRLWDITYASPMDWTCLAQNKHFDTYQREVFMRGLARNWHFGLGFTGNVEDLAPIYDAYHATHPFDDDETESLMKEVRLPPIDYWFEEIMEAPSQEKELVPDDEVEETNSVVSGIDDDMPEAVKKMIQENQLPPTESSVKKKIKLAGKYSEDFTKAQMFLAQGAPDISKSIGAMSDVYKIREYKLLGLAKNPHLPTDILYEILEIAHNAGGKYSDPLYNVIFALSQNPSIKNVKEGDVETANLKELLDNYEFPENFFEENLPEEIMSVSGKVDWYEGDKKRPLIDMTRRIKALVEGIQETTAAQTNLSSPFTYESPKFGVNCKGWTLVVKLNGNIVFSVEIRQTHNEMKVEFPNGNERLVSLYSTDIQKGIAELIEMVQKVENGEVISQGAGQINYGPQGAQTSVNSNFKKEVDDFVEKIIENLKPDYPEVKQILTNKIAKDGDYSELAYTITLPNDVLVNFVNTGTGVTITTDSILIPVKLSPAHLISTLEDSSTFYSTIKAVRNYCEELLYGKLLKIRDIVNKQLIGNLKYTNSFNKGINTWYLSFSDSSKNINLQLKNGFFKVDVPGQTELSFSVLNEKSISDICDTIVKAIHNIGEKGFIHDDFDYSMIVLSAVESLQFNLPSLKLYPLKVTPNKFRIMTEDDKDSFGHELSKLTFYSSSGSPVELPETFEVKVYENNTNGIQISKTLSPVNLNIIEGANPAEDVKNRIMEGILIENISTQEKEKKETIEKEKEETVEKELKNFEKALHGPTSYEVVVSQVTKEFSKLTNWDLSYYKTFEAKDSSFYRIVKEHEDEQFLIASLEFNKSSLADGSLYTKIKINSNDKKTSVDYLSISSVVDIIVKFLKTSYDKEIAEKPVSPESTPKTDLYPEFTLEHWNKVGDEQWGNVLKTMGLVCKYSELAGYIVGINASPSGIGKITVVIQKVLPNGSEENIAWLSSFVNVKLIKVDFGIEVMSFPANDPEMEASQILDKIYEFSGTIKKPISYEYHDDPYNPPF